MDKYAVKSGVGEYLTSRKIYGYWIGEWVAAEWKNERERMEANEIDEPADGRKELVNEIIQDLVIK